MDEIAKRRALKLEDNREWTAMDAVEDAIERIKDKDHKKLALMVVWQEFNDDSSSLIGWSAANIQRHEQIALMELLKHQFCRDYYGE